MNKKILVLAVRDIQVGAFGRPIFAATRGQAVRSFSDEVNRPVDGNQLASHPEDFQLWHLGEFDEETGEFTNVSKECIATGVNVKK